MMGRRMGVADLTQPVLERQLVQPFDPKAGEDLDAQKSKSIAES